MRIAYGSVAQPGAPFGYGVVGKMLGWALEKAGVEFTSGFDYDLAVIVGLPWSWLLGKEPRPDLIFHTMYEATPAPPDWVDVINRGRGVWAPSAWVRDLFIESGVTRPVKVGGYGVDTEIFRPVSRRGRDGTFRVRAWGRGLISRKNLLLAAQVFDAAGLPDAVLEIKVNSDDTVARDGPMPGLENVIVRKGDWKASEIVAWLQAGDVLLYLSSGEGFGLMPLEAMATGLPVICTSNSGMLDYLSENVALLVPCEGVARDAIYSMRFQHDASFLQPDFDAAVAHLRWAHDERERLYAIGERASAMVERNWTWRKAGERAAALLHEFL
jgi:glycosyltransferase involved in cell wall biosynthesis